MIHAFIAKDALIEANDIIENGLLGLLDWCMTKSGMEKNGGPITFDHVRNDKPDSVIVISGHDKYSPEEVLKEVIYDNDPRSALLITQTQKLAA